MGGVCFLFVGQGGGSVIGCRGSGVMAVVVVVVVRCVVVVVVVVVVGVLSFAFFLVRSCFWCMHYIYTWYVGGG